MAKRQLSFEALLDDEMSLEPPQFGGAGSLDIQAELTELLSQMIRDSGKDRHQIAADMSRLSGMDVTRSMLDAYTAASKEGHRFPLCLLPAFEVAVGGVGLQELIARKRGSRLLVGREVILARLVQVQEAKRLLAQQEAVLNKRIERMNR